MRISVITPALPTRMGQLQDALVSVEAQTRPPIEHLIGLDYQRRGTGPVKTDLALAAQGDWVATLEDDDFLHPEHLDTLAAHTDGADIVYSWCAVRGRPGWSPNREFDPIALRAGNFIPSTALIRRGLIVGLWGWRSGAACAHGWEDWDFWLRALDFGARFRCVPQVTWTYCFGAGNKTFHGEKGAF